MSKIDEYETVETQDHMHERTTKVLTIEHKGDTLAFEYEDLSWNEIDKLTTDSLEVDQRTEEVDFNMHQYKINYLKKAIVNSNLTQLNIWLKDIPPECEEIEDIVKDPREEKVTEDEEGN